MSGLLTFPLALLVVLVLCIAGYLLGRRRAVGRVKGDTRALHSRPVHHGWHVVMATLIPSFAVLVLWAFLQGLVSSVYLGTTVADDLPELALPESQREGLEDEEIAVREGARRELFLGNVRVLNEAIYGAISSDVISLPEIEAWDAAETDVGGELRSAGQIAPIGVTPAMQEAALKLYGFERTLSAIGPLLVMLLAAIGFIWALSRIDGDFRARNVVERWVMGLLIFASTVAILTTLAILAAVTFPSITFFREYGLFDFLFGLTWAPAGDTVGVPEGPGGEYESLLGFLPLIWGTLYISLVALLVATPLGLLAAIYLSEFADRRVRAWVKPALEVLAGVPTIVYGLFALVTIGPFLQAVVGTTIMPNTVSVMTAGVVMGMMLVPFVSSLSDDVINAVPQAMRDGSLGLGATPSETITKVILPAALPGIVGAVVLAASRAIGETMIVVLAAGALSNVQGLEPNPFGAVVTVTTRIVAVLTGEASGFDSIDVLAVFALAFTLFFITLALNLLAQRIVRRYREQYE
ncbi:phosphate ABC transporter permease subunit PstC [Pseudoroseicyclus tamaricis]|uniref:Phosphate transport system permease protein n=1 Tax=Pseudoroseicyclus tamaricis TaxID=2705421 RepID=A0A6B2JJL4_9RHOB|nr:phosphate ABC transporter permease subunit PstC [Pseudoroseicyclus tamaricis]NDV01633.1 phosphate ABC transporter permease subunit PstC [Pseudoroseicyclus tamaricis]